MCESLIKTMEDQKLCNSTGEIEDLVTQFEACTLPWRRLMNDLMNSKYADKNFPFEYYTKAFLMSAQARKEWIVPDRKKLDF